MKVRHLPTLYSMMYISFPLGNSGGVQTTVRWFDPRSATSNDATALGTVNKPRQDYYYTHHTRNALNLIHSTKIRSALGGNYFRQRILIENEIIPKKLYILLKSKIQNLSLIPSDLKERKTKSNSLSVKAMHLIESKNTNKCQTNVSKVILPQLTVAYLLPASPKCRLPGGLFSNARSSQHVY